MAEKWLVGLDTDQVKAYVFATGRLREIAGASAILDLLNREGVREKLTGSGEIVYAGGGSVLAIFDHEKAAHAFCAAVESLYPTETYTATISGDVMPYDEGEHFSDVFKRMARRLQMKKAVGSEASYLLSEAWWSRCDRCGQYGATNSFTDADRAEVALCEACQRKRGALEPNGDGGAEENGESVVHPLPMARLVDHAGEAWPANARLPETVEELGMLSQPVNYIGLIYADGNGVGRVLETELGSSDDFRVVSGILEEALLTACREATRPAWPEGEGELVTPFQPVLIGGDDVLMLTAAQYAIPIATRMCAVFQEEMRRLSILAKTAGELQIDEERLDVAMSAGVVIAKASHPLFALEEMAEALLISAKRQAREIGQLTGTVACTVDFDVVTASTARSLDIVRREEFGIGRAGNWGTGRPYPIRRIEGLAYPSMEDVIGAIAGLRAAQFPMSKLQQWRALANAATDTDALQISYLLSRLGTEQAAAMEEIVEAFGLTEGGRLFFYDPLAAGGNSRSPLPDLVALYDFVAGD